CFYCNDLLPFMLGIVGSREGDTIQIAIFDSVIIDRHYMPNAQTHELLDHWTAGARCANDRYPQAPKLARRAFAKGLILSRTEGRRILDGVVLGPPEAQIRTDHVDRGKILHPIATPEKPPEHPSGGEHDGAAVRRVGFDP